MFKTINLLKRRRGLTMEEFIAGYESTHRLLGELVLSSFAVRYVRRFLHPLPSDRPAARREPDADVVMEIWYNSRADYDRFLEAALPHRKAIAEDEARWFDLDSIRAFEVEEHVSMLPETSARDE